jgi:hypothetical protein
MKKTCMHFSFFCFCSDGEDKGRSLLLMGFLDVLNTHETRGDCGGFEFNLGKK